MQRDGYAVTGERGDDGCLITNAVEPILRCATDVTVRDMSDDDRFVEQWLRTVKPDEIHIVASDGREAGIPSFYLKQDLGRDRGKFQPPSSRPTASSKG